MSEEREPGPLACALVFVLLSFQVKSGKQAGRVESPWAEEPNALGNCSSGRSDVLFGLHRHCTNMHTHT